ncbi:MAG: winged helix-turn-helix transcriptional regulator [Alphaproteobacteria bacterium]|nr:winged helix-turn-helix transcriptional regulator [Alphaproteobacteria bacterium]
MTPNAQKFYALIREVRTCFNLLKRLSDDLVADLGINASLRAVIESLAEDGAQTVPAIAKSKGVSRQHIQVNMDGLLAKGLAQSRNNPAHKRAPLYALTTAGEEIFAKVRQRETVILTRLSQTLDSESLETGGKALADLNHLLTLEQGVGHDQR